MALIACPSMRLVTMVVVSLVACAPPAPQPCSDSAAARCSSNSTAEFCEPSDGSLRWVEYECADGCAGASRCSMGHATPGAPCPMVVEKMGAVACSATTAAELLECRSGAWRHVADCAASCRVDGRNIICAR